jgi:hypothetical protein
MKKNNLYKYFFLLFISTLVGSCSQEEIIDDAVLNPIADINNPTSNFFKVNFSGNTYKATTFTASKTNGKFLINGGKGTIGENISIAINGVAAGTYSSPTDIIVYNKSDATAFDYVSYLTFGTTTINTAQITIITVDATAKRISGTFDFVGYWANFNVGATVQSINFTNGSFEMGYTE